MHKFKYSAIYKRKGLRILMEYLSQNRVLRTFVLINIIVMSLVGCGSTSSVEEKQPECTENDTERCPAEVVNGDERGYNPCLVNKNLPVCKK
jgi:hypothetical protein